MALGGRPREENPNTKVLTVAINQRLYTAIESTVGNQSRSAHARGLLEDGLRLRKAQAMRLRDLGAIDDEEGRVHNLDELEAYAADPDSGFELLGHDLNGNPIYISEKSNNPRRLAEIQKYLDLDWIPVDDTEDQ